MAKDHNSKSSNLFGGKMEQEQEQEQEKKRRKRIFWSLYLLMGMINGVFLALLGIRATEFRFWIFAIPAIILENIFCHAIAKDNK